MATNSKAHPVALAGSGLALIAVTYGLARFAYGLFVPVFRNEFAFDAATAGAIAAGSYAAYCVGIVIATAATPRVGARPVAVAAGILATIGTALIAAAPDALVLAVGVVIGGSSTGVASPPLAQAVARTFDGRRRDRVQSVVNAGTGLGVMVSGPVALIVATDWRVAWGVFAVLSAAATISVAFAIPGARRVSTAERPVSTQSGAGTRRGRVPGAVRMLAASGVMGLSTAAVWTFAQDLFVGVGGQGRLPATIAWIVLGACGLLGAAAGDLIGRVGLRAAWVSLMLAIAASTAILAVVPQSVVVTVIASGVFGAVYIGQTGVLLVWSTRVFAASPARGVGLVFLVLALGQAAGSPLLGAIADAAGLPAAFFAAALIGAAGVVLPPPRRLGGQMSSGERSPSPSSPSSATTGSSP